MGFDSLRAPADTTGLDCFGASEPEPVEFVNRPDWDPVAEVSGGSGEPTASWAGAIEIIRAQRAAVTNTNDPAPKIIDMPDAQPLQ